MIDDGFERNTKMLKIEPVVPMRFCKNCKFSRKYFFGLFGTLTCTNLNVINTQIDEEYNNSPKYRVTNGVPKVICGNARIYYKSCGKDGNFFEVKT